MKHWIRFNIWILVLLAFNSEAQTSAKLIETVPAKSGVVNIPYKKYVYPNGLQLIIHEDHSDPIVYVDVTYHVGSARELPGRSGFAHFFEHMMFQGSDHVADEEHFKIITEAGGDMNGSTNLDRTNYFQTVPSNYLETALWLEADRMGFLLDAVTQQKFEVQRATVKNERGQNYDNRPYGLVTEKINEGLYPFGHPYSWTTIGYIDDLNAASLDDLKNFFLRWYGPNNATLTIAGDVQESQVLALVEKYFGGIPTGPQVKSMQPQSVSLKEDRYISYEDNIKFPLLCFTYPSVESFHPDEAPLDVLSYILGGTDNTNSILYQKFIKTQRAVQVMAINPSAELAGTFRVQILPIQPSALKDWETEIKEVVNNIDRATIEKQYREYALSYVSGIINGLTSVQSKGSTLANYQVRLGNPDYTEKEIQRYKNVTVDDVVRVYEKYIKNKPAVILSVYPKGMQEIIAHPDNVSRPIAPEGYSNDISEYQSLKYIKASDKFDRSVHPPKGPNPEVKVPMYWSKKLINGVKIIGSPYHEVPVTNISLYMKGGRLLEPKGKDGLASLTTALMMEATTKHNAEALSSILNSMGSTIDISAGREEIVVSVNSLNSNLVQTLALLEEYLFHPAWDSTDLELVRTQQLQAIKNQQTQARDISVNLGRKIAYDSNSPLSHADMGTLESVTQITMQDIKDFYKKAFTPKHSELVIVSSASKKSLFKNLSFIKKWKGENTVLPTFTPSKEEKHTTIYFCHKDKSPQSVISISGRTIPFDLCGDYFTLGIANYPLGGMFNSRINLNLREDKGYTYGARSYFSGTDFTDRFIAAASVRADVTDSAVIEFMKELKKFHDSGITSEELAFTKSSIGQSQALNYEEPGQKAGFLRLILLQPEFVQRQKLILQSITKSDIDKKFSSYVHPDHLAIIVVGDKQLVFENLKKLGYPLIEVDTEGNKLH
jgi:zinc protease